MNAAFPFSAEAANAPPQPKTRPAASTAGSSLARLRPDVEQRGLAGFHHRDRFLDRRSELGRILDRPLRPPTHGLRKLVVFDVRVLDAGADRPHVVAEISHAIAEVGQP